MSDEVRTLILETSGRIGHVGVASDGNLLAFRRLDEARRHARDLAPAVAELLSQQHWQPRDIHAVIVSQGPGSYTGLRVGIISAKAFAYATGCALLAVETFAAIALQAHKPGFSKKPGLCAQYLDVIADAQQDKIYVQRFAHFGAEWKPLSSLTIQPFPEWLANLDESVLVTGPGLRNNVNRLPRTIAAVAEEYWDPQLPSLLHIGLEGYLAGRRDDLLTLEPIYLRPSAAEQQWKGGSGS